jgi:hypothetical protein
MMNKETPTDTPIAMLFVLLLLDGAGVGVGDVVSVDELLVVVDDDVEVAVAVPGTETPACPKSLFTNPGSTENTPVEFVQHVPGESPVAEQQYRPPPHDVSVCHPFGFVLTQYLGHESEDHDLSVQAPRKG